MYDPIVEWEELYDYIKSRGSRGRIDQFVDRWIAVHGGYSSASSLAADISILEKLTEKVHSREFLDSFYGFGLDLPWEDASNFLLFGAIIVALDLLDAGADPVVGSRWVDRSDWIRAKTLWGKSWPTKADLPGEGTSVGAGEDGETSGTDSQA